MIRVIQQRVICQHASVGACRYSPKFFLSFFLSHGGRCGPRSSARLKSASSETALFKLVGARTCMRSSCSEPEGLTPDPKPLVCPPPSLMFLSAGAINRVLRSVSSRVGPSARHGRPFPCAALYAGDIGEAHVPQRRGEGDGRGHQQLPSEGALVGVDF